MPKKPCGSSGCNHLVPLGQSYCAQHTRIEQADRSARSDVGRTASESRKWYKRTAWSGKNGRRLQQLRAEPLCRLCPDWSKQPATVADHVVPHRGDHGLFWFGELQSLCKPCHDIKKQRIERRAGRPDALNAQGAWSQESKHWGYSIPHGVRPSGIPVVLVSGPPPAGKSTYIEANAKPGDTVIDFDLIRQRVGGVKWDTRQHINRAAFKLRDEEIHALHGKTEGTCYLIVTAPTEAERQAWRSALGNVAIHVIRTPEAQCIARIEADPHRMEAAARQIAAVRDWWAAN